MGFSWEGSAPDVLGLNELALIGRQQAGVFRLSKIRIYYMAVMNFLVCQFNFFAVCPDNISFCVIGFYYSNYCGWSFQRPLCADKFHRPANE